MPQPTNQLSDYEVDERAASAEAVLNDPVISEAIEGLRNKFVEALVAAQVGSADAMTAHSGLRVVDGFKAELQSMITEKKMRNYNKRSKTV